MDQLFKTIALITKTREQRIEIQSADEFAVTIKLTDIARDKTRFEHGFCVAFHALTMGVAPYQMLAHELMYVSDKLVAAVRERNLTCDTTLDKNCSS